MLKLYPLFSGSSGNMYLIETESANILVDIGVSYKKVIGSLEKINKNIDDIDALFITHEHSDHIKGLATFLKKTDIPIFSSNGTCQFLKEKLELDTLDKFNSLVPEKSFIIKDLSVIPFETSHDAVMPYGYTISSDDKSVTIATDLGYITENIYNHLSSSGLSVIESNYDNSLLMYGPYSYMLKQRIKSNTGHLSNDDTAFTIARLAKEGKRTFILGHLSENNNNPDIACGIITDTLKQNGFDINEFNINVATRDFSDEVYCL